jgi:hypothetical protein
MNVYASYWQNLETKLWWRGENWRPTFADVTKLSAQAVRIGGGQPLGQLINWAQPTELGILVDQEWRFINRPNVHLKILTPALKSLFQSQFESIFKSICEN